MSTTLEAPQRAFSVGESMMVSQGGIDENGRTFYGDAEVVPPGVTTEEAMRLAGIDFNVVQKPIFDEHGNKLPGFVRNVRETDDRLFGIVTSRFKVIQNADAFAVCDAVAEHGATWEAGGITDKGAFVWGLMTLPEQVIVAGDNVAKHLLFVNSHKGDRSVTMANTPVRLRCTNALTFSMRSAQQRITVRHTGDTGSKMQEAMALMGAANEYYSAFATLGGKLATKRLTAPKLERMLEQLYPAGTTDKAVDGAEEKRRVVRELVQSAPNLEGHHRTAWAFVNAVGEVADWGSARTRDRMSRLCWNGDARIKNRALKICQETFNLN